MSTAVIQGATGGLGLPLTRFLLQNTSLSITALTSRTSSSTRIKEDLLSGVNAEGSDLNKRLRVIPGVDLLREETVRRAAEETGEWMGGKGLRFMVCLAGILRPEKSLAQIDLETALRTMHLNSLGHLVAYKHFVPLVPTARQFPSISKEWDSDPANGWLKEGQSVLLSLSARVGSIGDNERGGWYSYRASKAALNQVIRTLDHELVMKKSSALAVAYHPGTTLTPFTAPVIGTPSPDPSKGLFTPDQAVEKLMHLVRTAERRKTEEGKETGYGGGFWDWKGERVVW